ncbi:MAG TPA: hypothetical protein VI524_11720 [Anaerolineales bacterium]|nr:hypothetical protein [Anaerolineales bacterium]
MKNKFLTLWTVLLVAAVMTSTASAGGNVRLSALEFSLGSLETPLTLAAVSQSLSFSLTATGTFTGLGGYGEGVTVELTASGDPVVTCTNQGGNESPGQNPPKVTAGDIQEIPFDLITKKGTAPLNVTAEPAPITGTQGGCPNDNWAAKIVFVFWTNATILVTDNVTGAEVFKQDYTCVTTRNPDNTGAVHCDPVQ